MEEDQTQIECYVNTGDEERDTVVRKLLSSLAPEQLIQRTLHAAGIRQHVMLTLLVTDDTTIQDLNKQYRQQDKPTDVLSFPLLDEPLAHAPADQLWMPPAEQQAGQEELEAGETRPTFVTPSALPTNLGDIVISWPTVLRQAAEAGHEPAYELLFLLAHGVLHLVGFDDATEVGYAAMVSMQHAVLQAMGWKAHSR